MLIIIGLFLVPVIVLFIKLLRSFTSNKTKRILLHISMLAVSLIYIVCALTLHVEPFDFEFLEIGDYLTYTAVVVLLSPCLWAVIYYYSSALFRKMRVHKNAKIKSQKQYLYYRDDLDKIPPSIVMFTYKMDLDMRKIISATVLKLKLNGYLIERNHELVCSNKEDSELTDSEKAILKYVHSHFLDEREYRKLVEKETLHSNYLKKNKGGILFKLLKMVATVLLPVVLILASIQFDEYVYDRYSVSILDDIRYLEIKDEKEVEDLYNNEVINKEDYYHSYDAEGNCYYSYYLVRADKLEYGIVREMALFRVLDPLFILFSIAMIFVSLFTLIEQIRYFNKHYKRTFKGNELVSKAYALKNYLKEYSLIKDRKEEELVLWEYYLIYAVVLGINEQIEDEIIKVKGEWLWER